MKKIFLSLLIAGVTGATAYGASAQEFFFSDQENFASWFRPSAEKMAVNGLMRGHEDGSFRPEDPVYRSELAVILDRFAERVLGESLQSESFACTTVVQAGLNLYLYDNYGEAISDASISLVGSSAESDFFQQSEGYYQGLHEAQGTRTIRIQKEGYIDHFRSYSFDRGDCHVIPQTDTVLLIEKLSIPVTGVEDQKGDSVS